MNKVKLLLVGMLVIACSTESASNYKTSEISANLSAEATGSGSTRVQASFGDSTHLFTFLQLTADDKLTASMGSKTEEMDETSILGAVVYHANFGEDAEGTTFHIKLTRELDSGAPDSYASLPPKFTLASLAKSEYARSEALTVSWDGSSNDPMSVDVSGECITSYSKDIGQGQTSFTLPAGSLVKATSEEKTIPDTCTATLTVTRSRTGTLDPAFRTGSFVARQVRSTTFKTK